MLRYVLRRLLTAIPTLFVIVTISFFLMRVAPGGPFNQEKGLNPVIKANLERMYNLDQPLWMQYVSYLKNLLKGDFGPSYNLPDFTVAELFANGLPISIQLGAVALSLALLIGGILGITAALFQNRPADYAVVATATAGSTIPTFVIAPLFQLFFALTLSWFPVGGWGNGALANKVGPIVTLMLPQLAVVARLMRGSMIESLRSHHIRTAEPWDFQTIRLSSGMPCAVRCCLSSPTAGPAAAALITGSIIVESIFAIPGVGRYFVEAALNRDYTLVMGTVVVIAIFTIFFNLDCRHSLCRRSIRGCAMTEVVMTAAAPTAGRSLWADAWARLQANKAAMVSAYYLIFMALLCIVGPWFTPHAVLDDLSGL